MMKNLDVFEVEEQEVINRTTQNMDLSTVSRQDVVKRLDFVLAITKDDEVAYLYEGLKSKLNDLTDAEWVKIRSCLPYQLLYSGDDVAPTEEEQITA